MELLDIFQYALRIFILLASILVLSLSLSSSRTFTAMSTYYTGLKPFTSKLDAMVAVLRFSSFTGVFGMVDIAVYSVHWMTNVIRTPIVIAVDSVTGLLFVASGATIAALLRKYGLLVCIDTTQGSSSGKWKGQCTAVKVDTAFMFLVFIALALAVGVLLFKKRSEGKSSSSLSDGRRRELHSAVEFELSRSK